MALLRARMARWWQSRLPLSDHVTLNQRNVYILPTRPGLMLALTLTVLLVASINYQLNLGYLLTFLLAGCALVAMHVGHGTLRGLVMHLAPPAAVHAGSEVTLAITLVNARRRARHGIALALHGTQQWVWLDVPGQAGASAQLSFVAARRGVHALPMLTAQTLFPLGCFRVWALWRPAAQVLVYPRPETNAPPLPATQADEGSSRSARSYQLGEADDLRPYRRGDPLKSIFWKKVARTGELVSRDSVALQQHELWLTQPLTGLQAPEQQLSRLCAWVLLAEHLGLHYGLRLPRQDIAPGLGLAHQERCLQALALA